MRILIVSTVYPPRAGGPSAQTYYLAGLLARLGHHVGVFTFREKSDPLPAEGVRIHSVEYRRGAPFVSYLATYVEAAVRLNSVMQRSRPNVIHVQTGSSWLALLAGRLARRHHIPVVAKIPGDLVFEKLNPRLSATNHEVDVDRTGVLAGLVSYGQRKIIETFDIAWVASSLHDRILREQYGFPDERIARLPNYQHLVGFLAISRERNEDSEPVRLLSVARLVPGKRIPDLLDIMSEIKDEAVTLTIVGDGPAEMVAQIQGRIKALGLDTRVRLAGHVSPTEIPGYMASADVLLHTSFQQWPGIVVVEAMASGLPVVLHHTGEMRSAEPYEETNCLVAQTVPQAAEHLRRLIRDSQWRRQLGDFNRQFAKRYDLEDNVSCFVDLYRQVRNPVGGVFPPTDVELGPTASLSNLDSN